MIITNACAFLIHLFINKDIPVYKLRLERVSQT